MTTFAARVERFDGSVMDVVVRTAAAAGLEVAKGSRQATMEAVIGTSKRHTVLVLRGPAATTTLAERIAVDLSKQGARVVLASVQLPEGQRGRNVVATATSYDANAVTPDDEAQELAEEIIADWQQEGTLYDESEAEMELATSLLAIDMEARRTKLVRFTAAAGARIAPFLEAIASGLPVEIMTVQGRPAVRMRAPDGSSRTAVLDESELAAIKMARDNALRSGQ